MGELSIVQSSENHNVFGITLILEKEGYVFAYNRRQRGDLLRLIGQYAANPEIELSWKDAEIISEQIGFIEGRMQAMTYLLPVPESLVSENIERSQSSWLSAIQEVCGKLGQLWRRLRPWRI